jgi:hypothetical protein
MGSDVDQTILIFKKLHPDFTFGSDINQPSIPGLSGTPLPDEIY